MPSIDEFISAKKSLSRIESESEHLADIFNRDSKILKENEFCDDVKKQKDLEDKFHISWKNVVAHAHDNFKEKIEAEDVIKKYKTE